MKQPKPWHLTPAATRNAIIQHLSENLGDYGDHPDDVDGSLCGDCQGTSAAIELLRGAAPYPDEAYVFACGYETYDLYDIFIRPLDNAWMFEMMNQFGHRHIFQAATPVLRPLTIAAADLIAAFTK